MRRHGDPETPWLAGVLNNEGEALLRLRRFQQAAGVFTEALTLQNKAPAVNEDVRFAALKGLGRAELGTGDLPRARAHLEQALGVTLKTQVIWSELAEVQLALAELLWTSEPDRERALSLVRSAQRAYASHGASFLDLEGRHRRVAGDARAAHQAGPAAIAHRLKAFQTPPA